MDVILRHYGCDEYVIMCINRCLYDKVLTQLKDHCDYCTQGNYDSLWVNRDEAVESIGTYLDYERLAMEHGFDWFYRSYLRHRLSGCSWSFEGAENYCSVRRVIQSRW